MSIDLFAGIPVSDFHTSLTWYEKLLGAPPSFFPHSTEAVWQLAEHRLMCIVERPEHAGHALQTILVDDLDTRMAGIAERGLEPTKRETYGDAVRKMTYEDPDGNEIAFGGLPS